ncbi:MAG: serine hydrolase domain-containing protein, partial [Chitinophagaceae bacterium]
MKSIYFLIAIFCIKTVAAQDNFSIKEKQTDVVAKQLINYLNKKQTDSAYLLASSNFKQRVNTSTWKNICEKQLYGLLPFTNLEYKVTKAGIMKYKMIGVVPFQLLINTDSTDKFVVFAIQPYQEEAKKKIAAKTDNSKANRIDIIVDSLTSDYINTEGNVGVSVAVYINNKEYYYNYGETKMNNQQLPTNRSLYEIGSITKTFTGILLAQAVIEKKLQLADGILKFLPDSLSKNAYLKGITLAHLSNHSSGLPRLPKNMEFTVSNYLQPYENYDEKALFTFLKNYSDTTKPGANYAYSNLGVGLLGTILERVYKKPF